MRFLWDFHLIIQTYSPVRFLYETETVPINHITRTPEPTWLGGAHSQCNFHSLHVSLPVKGQGARDRERERGTEKQHYCFSMPPINHHHYQEQQWQNTILSSSSPPPSRNDLIIIHELIQFPENSICCCINHWLRRECNNSAIRLSYLSGWTLSIN